MPDVPERMRAAYITGLGPADAVRVGELPLGVLGAAAGSWRARRRRAGEDDGLASAS